MSPYILLTMSEIFYLICRQKCNACSPYLDKLCAGTCLFAIRSDYCFQVVTLNVQMLPNATTVPTRNCLCSKILKKENSQKVGFLEAKVDRKAWDWSLTLIWGCTAGSPKVMLGREGDVYRLSKFTDSSCIKRRCCETRCWNKGEKQVRIISKLFILVTLSSLPCYIESQLCIMHWFATQWGSDKEKNFPCDKAVGISCLKNTTEISLGLPLG